MNSTAHAGRPDWPPVPVPAPAPVWPGGRFIAQWSRLAAGRSGDLGTGSN